MDWYYEENNEQRGPVAEEKLKELHQSGKVTPSTLVWRSGMEGWQAFASVGLTSKLAGPTCTECGRPFPESELLRVGPSSVCAECKPAFLAKVASGAPVGGMNGVWREGRALVIARNASLPDRCVKCNEPSLPRRLKRNLSWHNPFIYLSLLVSVVIYLILALCLRKRMTVMVGLCERHFRRRRVWMHVSFLVAIAGIAAIVFGVTMTSNSDMQLVAVIGGIVLVVASLFTGVIGTRVVYAVKIDNDLARVRGVCASYLEAFPEYKLS